MVRRTRTIEVRDAERGLPGSDEVGGRWLEGLLECFGLEDVAWEPRLTASEPGVFNVELVDDEAARIAGERAVLVDRVVVAEIVDHLPRPWEERGAPKGLPGDREVLDAFVAARHALGYAAHKAQEADMVYGDADSYWIDDGGEGVRAISLVLRMIERLAPHVEGGAGGRA